MPRPTPRGGIVISVAGHEGCPRYDQCVESSNLPRLARSQPTRSRAPRLVAAVTIPSTVLTRRVDLLDDRLGGRLVDLALPTTTDCASLASQARLRQIAACDAAVPRRHGEIANLVAISGMTAIKPGPGHPASVSGLGCEAWPIPKSSHGGRQRGRRSGPCCSSPARAQASPAYVAHAQDSFSRRHPLGRAAQLEHDQFASVARGHDVESPDSSARTCSLTRSRSTSLETTHLAPAPRSASCSDELRRIVAGHLADLSATRARRRADRPPGLTERPRRSAGGSGVGLAAVGAARVSCCRSSAEPAVPTRDSRSGS